MSFIQKKLIKTNKFIFFIFTDNEVVKVKVKKVTPKYCKFELSILSLHGQDKIFLLICLNLKIPNEDFARYFSQTVCIKFKPQLIDLVVVHQFQFSVNIPLQPLISIFV